MRTLQHVWTHPLRRPAILALLILAFALPCRMAPQAEHENVAWAPLVERLASDGHDPDELHVLFNDPRAHYAPSAMASKLRALLRSRTRGPEPPGAVPEVHERYLTTLALVGARGYLDLHEKSLEEAERRHGVRKEIQVAILLIESKLGMALGNEMALVTLASMALSRDFEHVRPYIGWDDLGPADKAWIQERNIERSEWAYRELDALLRYARAKGRDPLDIPGSIYGAIGYPQFMPTSAVAYGLDGDGDGIVDLFSTADALHSLCNFLQLHGWRDDLSREEQLAVLFKYNRDHVYGRTVLAIAERLGRY